MDNFLRTVEKLANAKGIVTILLLILVGFFIYHNLDFISEVTLKVDRPRPTAPGGATSAPKENGNARFEVTRLQITPVASRIPSAFFTEVKNSGFDRGGVEITVDFGRAQIQQFEVIPAKGGEVLDGVAGSNRLKVRYVDLGKDESIYIYALLSAPYFQRVIVNPLGSSMSSVKTIADMEDPKSTGVGFWGFLQVVAAGLVIVFAIYFAIVIITLLNKWLKL